MKRKMKVVMSLALCFGLVLSQFSYIGAVSQSVSLSKSQTSATSGACPASVWGWYTASNGVTSTTDLLAMPQAGSGSSWGAIGSEFNEYIGKGQNYIESSFPGDNGSSFRLRLVGNKKCIGSGIVKNL